MKPRHNIKVKTERTKNKWIFVQVRITKQSLSPDNKTYETCRWCRSYYQVKVLTERSCRSVTGHSQVSPQPHFVDFHQTFLTCQSDLNRPAWADIVLRVMDITTCCLC